MRITYDAEVDALSIIFHEGSVTTRELAQGIAVEYDAAGKLAGLEILDASDRLSDSDTMKEVVLQGIGLSSSNR